MGLTSGSDDEAIHVLIPKRLEMNPLESTVLDVHDPALLCVLLVLLFENMIILALIYLFENGDLQRIGSVFLWIGRTTPL